MRSAKRRLQKTSGSAVLQYKEKVMYYGMFTDKGNRIVDGIVIAAKESGWSFEYVLGLLTDLASVEGLEEAMDTAVKEYVYEAMETV